MGQQEINSVTTTTSFTMSFHKRYRPCYAYYTHFFVKYVILKVKKGKHLLKHLAFGVCNVIYPKLGKYSYFLNSHYIEVEALAL